MIDIISAFTIGLAIGFLAGFFVYNGVLQAVNNKEEEESELITRLCRMDERER